MAIMVPPNAYLNHTGTGWACDRGYRVDDNACVAIEVPANGYLTEANYGPGWNASVAIARRVRGVSLSSCRRTRISTIPAMAGTAIHLTESDRMPAYHPKG